MRIQIFQIDAFTDTLFKGNPAAICPLDRWLSDDEMQAIAQENNLSETAFFRLSERPMNIRWFTPLKEVKLCGHATLAAAHVLSAHLGYRDNPIRFQSLSGPLYVLVEGNGRYTLDFPCDKLTPISLENPYLQHFDQEIIDLYRGESDYLLLVDSVAAVRCMRVDYQKLCHAERRGFIVTTQGRDCDYVARCFYPQTGIDEDPATGSSHTTLAPFWAERLGKAQFTAKQLSSRGAVFETELKNNRVLITGNAVSYLEGVITI